MFTCCIGQLKKKEHSQFAFGNVQKFKVSLISNSFFFIIFIYFFFILLLSSLQSKLDNEFDRRERKKRKYNMHYVLRASCHAEHCIILVLRSSTRGVLLLTRFSLLSH